MYIGQIPYISPAIQNMIGEEITKTKNAVAGNKTSNWLIAVVAVIAIIYFVKKVT